MTWDDYVTRDLSWKRYLTYQLELDAIVEAIRAAR